MYGLSLGPKNKMEKKADVEHMRGSVMGVGELGQREGHALKGPRVRRLISQVMLSENA